MSPKSSIGAYQFQAQLAASIAVLLFQQSQAAVRQEILGKDVPPPGFRELELQGFTYAPRPLAAMLCQLEEKTLACLLPLHERRTEQSDLRFH